jgi:hypothetical protein
MTRTTMAVAADYADAMLIARRWKNILFLLLLLFLLVQIGVFLAVRLSGSPAASASTQPAIVPMRDMPGAMSWLINFTGFLSMIVVVVLAVVLLLIVGIMLIGRLIGVSQLTAAFVLCVVLAAILFPWQALWNYPVAGTLQGSPAPVENLEVGPRFGLPGALYTWPELQHRAYFSNSPLSAGIIGWARFVGWPVVAIILLFSVQVRSSRGLKFALGETEVHVTQPTTPATPGSV